MAASRKQWRHPKAISEHAFDKLHLIDCTLAELETALDSAEIIEERELDDPAIAATGAAFGISARHGKFRRAGYSTAGGPR